MNTNKAGKIAKVLVIAIVAATALGFIVKALWNALIPAIFGLHTITFWQALGLLILAKILFGGFHRHGHYGGGRAWRQKMKERWEHMTPEERDRFRQKMRCYRGPFASPAGPQH